MTRLYIVEGLPCSGKSTTAKYIADRLTERGAKVICIDEGSGDHPADYEYSAYVSDSDQPQFTERLREQIKECSERIKDGYIVPLSKFNGEDFDKLLQYKIYDYLPWETEMPLMLGKWESFAENAEKDAVYVFNCVFLQNPMCETMMRFHFSPEQSFAFISKIAERIKPLEPAVIYLKSEDISERIAETAKERGGWLEAVIDYHINSGYGKSINVQGFDGYISCLEERQRRELSMLEKLPVKSVVIDNAHRDWDMVYQKIINFIKTADEKNPYPYNVYGRIG